SAPKPRMDPMYKLLLCWRYLKTRYLALACIISVMLGVATLIVVNSVMSGFSTKLRERLHGLLSDVVIESYGLEGFADPQGKMARIRKHPFLGQQVEAMTATMEVFAMVQFRYPNGELTTRPVKLIGIDPETRTKLGGFQEHLVKQRNSTAVSFQVAPEIQERYRWQHQLWEMKLKELQGPADPDGPPPPMEPPRQVKIPCGIMVGHLIAHYRRKEVKEGEEREACLLKLGDEIKLFTLGGGQGRDERSLAPVYDNFVV